MKPEDVDLRLSRIATLWTLHARAHAGDATAQARAELLQRYRGAAYRYLLAALRNADAADDSAQEFAVKFLRGDFGGADPHRGRFRDYLRTSLSRLATDHFRAKLRDPAPLGTEPAAPDHAADESFHAAWREELLERTWRHLEAEQPTGHAALRLRVEEPELTSAEMARRLSAKSGKPVSPEAVRKALQRAHERFADLLLDEVAATLEDRTPAALEEELRAVDLLRYCRGALEKRQG